MCRRFLTALHSSHSDVSAPYIGACLHLIGCGCISTARLLKAQSFDDGGVDKTLPVVHFLMDSVLVPTVAGHASIRENNRSLRLESRGELNKTRAAVNHPNYRLLTLIDESFRARECPALQAEHNQMEVGTRSGLKSIAADEFAEIEIGAVKKATNGEDTTLVWDSATALEKCGRRKLSQALGRSCGVFDYAPRSHSEVGGAKDVQAAITALRPTRFLQKKPREAVNLKGEKMHEETRRIQTYWKDAMRQYVEAIRSDPAKLLEWPAGTKVLKIGCDWKEKKSNESETPKVELESLLKLTNQELQTKKSRELKGILKALGLDPNGNKSEVVEKLSSYLILIAKRK